MTNFAHKISHFIKIQVLKTKLFEYPHPFFERLKLFFTRFSHRKSERHFRNQMPMSGQIPCTTHLVVNQRIIVLQ